MAKIAFSKLKLKVDDSVKEVKLTDEIIIEVKQYLPIQEKLALIGRVIELAHMQDENYSNPVKAAAFRDLEIVECYTNISFTDKQKEDPAKLYDLLYSTGTMNMILDNIPEDEYLNIKIGIKDSIEAIYKYHNSVLGILDTIKEEYDDMQLGVSEIAQDLVNNENFAFVKDMLTNIN